MCSNGSVGCGVGGGGKNGDGGAGCNDGGDDSGDVDEIVAKGPKDVSKRCFPLFWLNSPLYRGGGGGVGGGGGSDIGGDV